MVARNGLAHAWRRAVAETGLPEGTSPHDLRHHYASVLIAGGESVVTVAAQDPISKIPQYKVCGCRVRKAESAPTYAAVLEPQQ